MFPNELQSLRNGAVNKGKIKIAKLHYLVCCIDIVKINEPLRCKQEKKSLFSKQSQEKGESGNNDCKNLRKQLANHCSVATWHQIDVWDMHQLAIVSHQQS
ncbi:hypothetical protein NPIL_151841 [Nephila pilipes]|uniref:Uncharacterized protein n=1 Tax=Nephila pilipes TaxID=299642 RepID=A0A8X6P6S8_NEPPI|nr:hypothetical protein NPIL_151841 [Nephila pilipes]